MPTVNERFRRALEVEAKDFRVVLDNDAVKRLGDYHELLLKWNDKLHLVAPCSPEVFATRHVLESLMLVRHLPKHAVVIDVGTGAGLPLIPCLILRNDLRAKLIESSPRKGVFLREPLRRLRLGAQAEVIVGRFEQINAPEANFVACRALDRFSELLPALIAWLPPNTTVLLFAGESLRGLIESILPLATSERIPQSERRFLIVGQA